MLNELRTFFDHSRHKLWISELDTTLDVLVFTGTERLSEPFSYQIEFTSTDQDIAVERVLNRQASFSLYAAPKPLLKAFPGFPEPEIKPLRTLHGVITGFQRLSGSNDEARYAVTLEPRLALLGRGKQTRIYQHQSVPQIVEKVLRSRHEFLGQDFYFNIVREYPPRLQVMQYNESDLAFITRLLAEVGIWFRFATDERLRIEVVEFHDDQRHYLDPRPSLPSRPPSGLSGGDQDAVWALQASHQVVEQRINFRAYDPRKATVWLDGEVDQTRGATTTYGEAYHYAEAYTELGGKLDQDEDLLSESGFFYARLRHERYLNEQTCLSGTSNSPTLALAQVLDISGAAPQAFAPGAVITGLTLSAARDTSLLVNFEAIPYVETVCFRPPLQKKPCIAGTLPARVTSNRANDPYSHINLEGRYKVSFLFDRDDWKQGEESLWLRLARPYAGDTHGLHLPLICGTEVAIAFEQGDPDRPYIAHALHDNKHPDHVTLARRDYKRNVLRTPANNKLRMEDERGQEHIKLSTEHSGKSQLNLGHLVDAQKQKRGEGFELRTDGWGAIRGGKGLFITAEERSKASSRQLDMDEAVEQLESALSLARSMAEAARSSECTAGDSDSQSRLTNALTDLVEPGLLLHAPAGIGLVSPEAICVASGRESIGLMSAHQTDISAGTSITATAEEAISLCAKKADLQLKATQGDVELHAHSGKLHALANTDIKIESVAGRVEISAPEELLISCGGAYIRIKDGEIELGAPNNLILKVAHVDKFRGTTLDTPVTPIPHGYSAGYTIGDAEKGAAPFTRYRITTARGEVFRGVTDKDGRTMPVHTQMPGDVKIELPKTEGYEGPFLPEDLEEEEEEEELTEGITLRLGLFFDGTGNNLSNSSVTERCQRDDLNLYSASELESLVQTCKRYGYDQFNGELFEQVEDTSYANSASNVAHLYDLYPDHATDGLPPGDRTGYVKVYLEGIGTNSGGKDSLISQGTGKGKTGVVSRVIQSPALIRKELERFQQANTGAVIRRIEIDIFGFSRGAASARHCANEFLKSDCGMFREMLKPGRFGLQDSFDPKVDIRLNLIGLFDTVAAIVNPLVGDFSPGNEHNSGVNQYLPAGCARQVVQLNARDELRENFALNSVLDGHRQIGLPGVHSDVGGGYRPNARERLWVVQPQRIVLEPNQTLESHPRWQTLEKLAQRIQDSGRYGKDSSLQALAWATMAAPRGRDESPQRAYWATVVMERMVRGELARVSLRVMRELGVRHGVPFKSIESRPELQLPTELQPIAERILEQIEAGDAIKLDPEQEELLRARYIHCSAHWVPTAGLMINKPARHERRNEYPNLPQKGYPQ